MLGMHPAQVGTCSVLGAVLVAMIVYHLFQQTARAPEMGPAPCDSCASGGVSARQADAVAPSAAPPGGAGPTSVDPNPTTATAAATKAGISNSYAGGMSVTRYGFMEQQDNRLKAGIVGNRTNQYADIVNAVLGTGTDRAPPVNPGLSAPSPGS